ncbi:hypothetical protein ABFA07_011033 [Porites harrisoni]
MADDDERSRRKANPGQNKKPYWQETCIGVWTKSIKGHHVNSEADQDKICNGISVVRIYGKPTDDSSVKLSKTRGLQIIICIDSEHQHPPPKPHDHTYISVERVEADDNEEKTANGETDPTKEQMPSLTRRVMDVMLMKKTNMEKNVEHFKSNGIKLTDVWDGVYGTCSKCYETTARLVSYCHPVEKVTQVSMKRRISKENQSYINYL